MNPKQEVEDLMNALVPFAKSMLASHGEFFPYGGYLSEDGAVVEVGVSDPGHSRPKSRSLIESLESDFRKKSSTGSIRGCCIIFDVRIIPPGGREKSDAIQVNLDHAGGYSAEVFFPYCITAAGKIEFGEIFAQEGDYRIFV